MDNTKVRVENWYFCKFCDSRYSTPEEAEKCFDRGFKPNFKVGDIVTGGEHTFGWYDGDAKWIADTIDGNSYSGKLHTFYYVVTFVDGGKSKNDSWDDAHRPRYHIATKAMTGEKGHRGGYTFDQHHITIHKVENPPIELIEDSKDLLNKKMDWLL